MKKVLILLFALIITAPVFASVAISPTCVEIDARKARSNYVTGAIEIKGDPVKTMRFKVYPGFFNVDEHSDVIMIEKSDSPLDISKKLRFVPSEFTILPGKNQKLRLNVANINSLPNGESRAMLYIEDVNPKEYALPTGQAGIGAQLIVKTRVGVPVYVDKGNVSKVGEVEYFKLVEEKDGIYTDLKVLSKGNSKIRYSTHIQIAQGKKLIKEYNLPNKIVLGGQYGVLKEKLDTSGIKEAGEYTVRAVVSYFDANNRRKSIKQEAVLNIQGEM